MTRNLEKTHFKIDGMDCASCASKIDRAASRIDGVESVSVSVANSKMTVIHQPDADLKKLTSRLKTMGYKAEKLVLGKETDKLRQQGSCSHDHTNERDSEQGAAAHGHTHSHDHPQADASKLSAPEGTLTSRFSIAGMDCAGCASKIDAAVRRVPGIKDVAVVVATQTATISHSRDADVGEIVNRINKLGYTAEAYGADPEPASGGNDRSAHARATVTAGKAWYTQPKAKLTLGSGFALVAAFLAAQAVPDFGFVFYTAAMLIGLIPIARRAVMGALYAGTPFSIETLMTIAAVGAILIGATQEAAVVVLLFLVGELLEGVAAGRARSSISALTDLVPKTAILIADDGTTRQVSANSLSAGDMVLIRPGDRIPADGVILSGEGAVDQAPVTGESTPILKQPEDLVFAGTINGDAALRLQVTAAAENNTIARIVKLVEEAQESKAPTERFIDRFSRYYTPAVVLVAALVAVVPPLVFGASWSDWVYRGLALLLIGCPCALVISTPAAIAASLSAGARRGLLIKGGAVLETLGKVNAVAFDKTGTLTEGRPKVTDILPGEADEATVLRLAASLESGSSHPLAKAILDEAEAEAIMLASVEDASSLGGKGVTGKVDGRELFLGSLFAAKERNAVDAETEARILKLQEEGKSSAILLEGRTVLGTLAMRDEPRKDAIAAIKQLSEENIRTVMLTGDNDRTARAIGSTLGIEVRSELMPEDKQRIVRELQARGAVVAKVGDGINDAPALAAADVGIAMGGGTDVALETGDAASLYGRVLDIASMIRLSRRTMINIWQNISIALGLKAVFLVTTVFGITGLWPAILADTGATVLVTINALRLLRIKSAD